MKRKNMWFKLILAALMMGALVLGGCTGDDGNNGKSAYEVAVDNGFTGTEQEWLDSFSAAAANVEPEQCAVCHSGNVARNGVSHQEIYDDYVDTTFDATITGVSSVATGATFTVTMTFMLEKDGEPYVDVAGLPTLEQARFYIQGYDSATRKFNQAFNISLSSPTPTGTPGEYTVTKTGATYAPELTNSEAYLYVADGPLEAGSHYSLYTDVANTGLAFGDAASYVSTANVSACERCHGTPYRKHGYRAAAVDNLADFGACKACHYDDRNGGHQAWQLLVDDPAAYAAQDGAPTDTQKTYYAYKASVMNDVHMSHAMEFPYPMSMANCSTCHEGHMDMVTTDANFVSATCKSCHPIDGVGGTDSKRAPAIKTLWADNNLTSVHTNADLTNNDYNCAVCHTAGGAARSFSQLHTGYDSVIYASDGTKYADAITVSIDSITMSGTDININFSAAGTAGGLSVANIVPSVYVAAYGYDTKDFIVSNHSRDNDGNRVGEYTFGQTNPYFSNVVTNGDGTWSVTYDTTALTGFNSEIEAGAIRRLEVAIAPSLKNAAGTVVGLDAPSVTFDLTTGAMVDYYEPIADAAKCNNCHDQLATTFHSPIRGGNITVCRMCHVVGSGGSHLELQSRSIDSYVHAIHSFQLFDIGDIDENNPVDELQAELHLEHVFPNFTRLNCEACHVDATADRVPYNVPDQSKSMPGVLSGSDAVEGRNIGDIPSLVTGPAARACGGCHRADFINEDDAGGLAAFMQHTKANGYALEDGDGVLDTVTKTIMSMFQ